MIARIAGALCGLTLTFAASAAMAQQSGTETECVSAKTDWSVCVWNDPKECWGVSKPKETVNTRDGRPVQASRSEILLFVRYAAGERPSVSFTSGYQLALDAPIRLTVGSDTFEFVSVDDDPATRDYNENEFAWPGDPAMDATVIQALQRGQEAVMTARSRRGTDTKDTFSLNGFTAAMTEAEARCK
ncbi:MAG: invasion associated locus B family protein [Gemmobacter sp.]